ncbi:MAG: glycosyltransferase [Leptolyngbyaceae cyanobacterium CSU_1_4]|nr:glycosyltransferase [Leptolyngbyaceae cyanobacterium CSU_1_4]
MTQTVLPQVSLLQPSRPLVSVVMPCLNEEEAIGICIEKIQRTFETAGINGEIVVCDNGSTDDTVRSRSGWGRGWCISRCEAMAMRTSKDLPVLRASI